MASVWYIFPEGWATWVLFNPAAQTNNAKMRAEVPADYEVDGENIGNDELQLLEALCAGTEADSASYDADREIRRVVSDLNREFKDLWELVYGLDRAECINPVRSEGRNTGRYFLQRREVEDLRDTRAVEVPARLAPKASRALKEAFNGFAGGAIPSRPDWVGVREAEIRALEPFTAIYIDDLYRNLRDAATSQIRTAPGYAGALRELNPSRVIRFQNDDGEQAGLAEIIRATWSAEERGNVWVTGGNGAGKTSAMIEAALELIGEDVFCLFVELRETSGPYPVDSRISTIMPLYRDELANRREAEGVEQPGIGQPAFGYLASMLERYGLLESDRETRGSGRPACVLMLDGWDELRSERGMGYASADAVIDELSTLGSLPVQLVVAGVEGTRDDSFLNRYGRYRAIPLEEGEVISAIGSDDSLLPEVRDGVVETLLSAGHADRALSLLGNNIDLGLFLMAVSDVTSGRTVDDAVSVACEYAREILDRPAAALITGFIEARLEKVLASRATSPSSRFHACIAAGYGAACIAWGMGSEGLIQADMDAVNRWLEKAEVIFDKYWKTSRAVASWRHTFGRDDPGHSSGDPIWNASAIFHSLVCDLGFLEFDERTGLYWLGSISMMQYFEALYLLRITKSDIGSNAGKRNGGLLVTSVEASDEWSLNPLGDDVLRLFVPLLEDEDIQTLWEAQRGRERNAGGFGLRNLLAVVRMRALSLGMGVSDYVRSLGGFDGFDLRGVCLADLQLEDGQGIGYAEAWVDHDTFFGTTGLHPCSVEWLDRMQGEEGSSAGYGFMRAEFSEGSRIERWHRCIEHPGHEGTIVPILDIGQRWHRRVLQTCRSSLPFDLSPVRDDCRHRRVLQTYRRSWPFDLSPVRDDCLAIRTLGLRSILWKPSENRIVENGIIATSTPEESWFNGSCEACMGRISGSEFLYMNGEKILFPDGFEGSCERAYDKDCFRTFLVSPSGRTVAFWREISRPRCLDVLSEDAIAWIDDSGVEVLSIFDICNGQATNRRDVVFRVSDDEADAYMSVDTEDSPRWDGAFYLDDETLMCACGELGDVDVFIGDDPGCEEDRNEPLETPDRDMTGTVVLSHAGMYVLGLDHLGEEVHPRPVLSDRELHAHGSILKTTQNGRFVFGEYMDEGRPGRHARGIARYDRVSGEVLRIAFDGQDSVSDKKEVRISHREHPADTLMAASNDGRWLVVKMSLSDGLPEIWDLGDLSGEVGMGAVSRVALFGADEDAITFEFTNDSEYLANVDESAFIAWHPRSGKMSCKMKFIPDVPIVGSDLSSAKLSGLTDELLRANGAITDEPVAG